METLVSLGITESLSKIVALLVDPQPSCSKKINLSNPKLLSRPLPNPRIAMSSTSILAMNNFSKPFVTKTGASEVDTRAVLLQDEQPHTYISKALSTNK